MRIFSYDGFYLLVHSELAENKPSDQQPTGIHKCNHPRCLTCSFLQEGQTSYTFFTTKETREITNYISCHSKHLIYLIQWKKCHCQYIGETKRQLNERFGEHRRSILNHHQLSNPTTVSLHFNQPGHSINDVHLIHARHFGELMTSLPSVRSYVIPQC